MIALYIVGGTIFGIIFLLLILLQLPVQIFLRYWDGIFQVSIRYAFLQIYPRKPGKKKKERRILENQFSDSMLTQEEAEGASLNEEQPQLDDDIFSSSEKREENICPARKSSIWEKISIIKRVLQGSGKGFRRLIRNIRIDDLELYFVVANEDAAQTAIQYGGTYAAVYNFIVFLQFFFSVSIKNIDILCKYNSKESVYNGSCVLKLSPGTFLLSALGVWVRYHRLKRRERNNISATAVTDNH